MSFLVISFLSYPAEASTGSIIDTFINESLIASKSYLDIISGEVYLDVVSTKYENYSSTLTDYSRNLYSNYWAAETFTVTEDHKINSVKLRLQRPNSGTGGNFNVYIRTTTDGLPTQTTLCSTSISRAFIPSGVSLVQISLPEIILSAGTMYAIVLNSPNSSSGSVIWHGYTSDVYADGSWIQSNNSGVNWTELASYDFSFEVWGDAYYSSGNFVSANLLDELDVSSVDSFDYNVSSLPDGSSIQIQFSPDNLNWYNSSGILNGWESLSAGENTISLSSLGWAGEEFYYKTTFLTSSDAATAVLDEIKLNYSEGIPEPASLLLLGFGVAGIAMFRKNRVAGCHTEKG